MKTSIDHLPARKQEELRSIVEILRAGAPVEMIILFGSHARGDWVEDPEEGYFSDWDVLVVVERPKVADDVVLWSRLGTEANAVCNETAVALIAHDSASSQGWRVQWDRGPPRQYPEAS
jgi:predicted nucleotidyltransferase